MTREDYEFYEDMSNARKMHCEYYVENVWTAKMERYQRLKSKQIAEDEERNKQITWDNIIIEGSEEIPSNPFDTTNNMRSDKEYINVENKSDSDIDMVKNMKTNEIQEINGKKKKIKRRKMLSKPLVSKKGFIAICISSSEEKCRNS